MAVSNMSLKLLINNKEKRVLFAEAGSDFVDFLFSLLSLPVGTITRLLTKESMAGSFGNLYKSIEDLNDKYIQPNQHKNTFLNPNLPLSAPPLPLLSLDSPAEADRSFYQCPDCTSYVSEDSDSVCPDCGTQLYEEVKYVAPTVTKKVAGEGKGFVKGVVTYMVFDDLTVQPLSTITLINRFNIDDLSMLEERDVNLGIHEGLKLLKASLEKKTLVLTSVFLEA